MDHLQSRSGRITAKPGVAFSLIHRALAKGINFRYIRTTARALTTQRLSAPEPPTFSVSGLLAERYPERQCSTGLWYITVSQDICPPMEHWGIYITQHARIHTSRTSSSTSSSRWRSRIARWLSVLHEYTTFSLRPFSAARVRIPPESQFNYILYHAYDSRQWAIGGRISCDTVIYHSPVKHWRPVYMYPISPYGTLTENVSSVADRRHVKLAATHANWDLAIAQNEYTGVHPPAPPPQKKNKNIWVGYPAEDGSWLDSLAKAPPPPPRATTQRT